MLLMYQHKRRSGPLHEETSYDDRIFATRFARYEPDHQLYLETSRGRPHATGRTLPHARSAQRGLLTAVWSLC